MRLIAASLVILSLAGCSTARKAMGFVTDIGSKADTANPETIAANSDASIAARGITRADDMKSVSKGKSGGLIGDTQHSLHSGDPIPPQ
jgi:hypothetical protein